MAAGQGRARLFGAVLAVWLAAAGLGEARIKVLADQDSAGPEGTNFLSLLLLLLSPEVDLLGITTVSGDQWVRPSTIFALHAVELAGREDVPVVAGAEQPLLHRADEQEALEALYGSYTGWHGAFNPDAPPPDRVWPPPGGMPALEPRPGFAADFIVETVRAHPGEVVLYCAGPLTNLALAVRMDPDIVRLVRSLHIMGGSTAGGPELNFWWDPEAAAIVLREPWREIVVTPFEAGAQVFSSEALFRPIAEAGGRLAEHVRAVYLEAPAREGLTPWSMMWDEIAVARLVDPAVVRRAEVLSLDVVIDHGPTYGHTLVWRPPPGGRFRFFLPYSGPDGLDPRRWRGHLEPPYNRHPASVAVEIDEERFERFFVETLSR